MVRHRKRRGEEKGEKKCGSLDLNVYAEIPFLPEITRTNGPLPRKRGEKRKGGEEAS